MKNTKIYDPPQLIRVMPFILEQGICTSPIDPGSSVNTTGKQVEEMNNFSTIWK